MYGVYTELAVTATAVCAFGFTYAALWVINKFTSVKLSDKSEEENIDLQTNKRECYVFILVLNIIGGKIFLIILF